MKKESGTALSRIWMSFPLSEGGFYYFIFSYHPLTIFPYPRPISLPYTNSHFIISLFPYIQEKHKDKKKRIKAVAMYG